MLRTLAFACLFLVACSTTQQGHKTSREFVLDRSWARQTTQKDYLGFRLNHTMEPILHAGMVIQGNEIDGLVAYDQKSGQKKWTRRIDGGVTSAAREKNGVIYFGAGDGFFYAVEAVTGQTKWSFPIRSEGIGSPLVTNDAVYFLAGNNSAYALKIGSGEQIWFYTRQDSASITVRGASEPSLVGQKLLLGFSDGYLVSLDKDKGTLIWERQLGLTPRFHDVDTKPVVDGERVYVSSYDGQLYCLNASSGATIWQNDEGGFAPVTIVGEYLYYSTSSRKVMSIEKSSGKVLWEKNLTDTVASQPVVHRGLVIYGEWAGKLQAVDQMTGTDVASYSTGHGVTSKAVVDPDSDLLYVMSTDANLFALHLHLRNKVGVWPWEE
jgi:outer membrane protein assembly factor BamB